MSITSINRHSGNAIQLLDHLKQSMADILTTPIGSRVMRRTYGSYLFRLVDQANNGVGLMRVKAAIADAILRWEPRVILTKIDYSINLDGTSVANITGRCLNRDFSFSIPIGGQV